MAEALPTTCPELNAQVYNETVQDLLSKNPREDCKVRQGRFGTFVEGLVGREMTTDRPMEMILEQASCARDLVRT